MSPGQESFSNVPKNKEEPVWVPPNFYLFVICFIQPLRKPPSLAMTSPVIQEE